jgi:beta-N-acetylhexosaminidase
MDEMREVAAEASELSGQAARRAEAALAARKAPSPIDLSAARHAFAAMMASGTV